MLTCVSPPHRVTDQCANWCKDTKVNLLPVFELSLKAHSLIGVMAILSSRQLLHEFIAKPPWSLWSTVRLCCYIFKGGWNVTFIHVRMCQICHAAVPILQHAKDMMTAAQEDAMFDVLSLKSYVVHIKSYLLTSCTLHT